MANSGAVQLAEAIYYLSRLPLSHLTPDPSVVGNEANRYIRRPMDQGSRAQVCVGEDFSMHPYFPRLCRLTTYAIEFLLSLQAPLT